MGKNVLIAQSGGPSPVINSSLFGVIEACRAYPEKFGKVFAAWHGIEGVLLEELIDLNAQPKEEIALLKFTPATGAIGSCRYKLHESQSQDFRRILDVFAAHDIGYFFYIGGNDSMDTANKVSQLAKLRGMELVVTGIPKTIDNDVGDDKFSIIDHTPGYASAARYWALLIQNINEENKGMSVSEPVSVLQAMGRKAGFIAAAARLGDPNREMPLQLYLPETGQNLETLTENVNRQIIKDGRCIVVVGEGFDVGSLGEATDGFGHIEYGASKTTVAQVVTNYLNENRIKARGQATCQVPGVIQRGVSMCASEIDIDEACEVAKHAVKIAVTDGGGYMSATLRKPGESYEAFFGKAELGVVANSFRALPKSWIASSEIDVTDDFVKYAMPLIGTKSPGIKMCGGLQRFAKIDVAFIDKKLPEYVPESMR